MLLVYVFPSAKFIFPIFTITAFFYSMILHSMQEVCFSFLPLFIIFLIHLFLPDTIYSIVIIYIFFIPLSFYLGFKLRQKIWYYKTIYPLLTIVIAIYGFSNFYYFIKNYNARQKNATPIIELFTEDNKVIRLDTIKNKIIVLDFWTINCSICFKKFPYYEKAYLKYKNNPHVELYAINIPTRKDTIGEAKKIINNYNYQFPKLYANSDSIPKSLGFNKYPHVVIIYNGEIRYNGLLVMDKDLLVHKLNDEIETLLSERLTLR